MTLLVMGGGMMLGDNCIAADYGTSGARLTKGRKIFLERENRVAVGFLGQIPHTQEIQQYCIDVISIHVMCAELGLETPTLPESIIDKVLAGGRASYIAMTKKFFYELDGVQTYIRTDHVDHAFGTGMFAFYTARAAGFDHKACYPIVADVVHTVGELDMVVKQSDLKPLVLTDRLAKLKKKDEESQDG